MVELGDERGNARADYTSVRQSVQLIYRWGSGLVGIPVEAVNIGVGFLYQVLFGATLKTSQPMRQPVLRLLA